jgi:hypothetical protein
MTTPAKEAAPRKRAPRAPAPDPKTYEGLKATVEKLISKYGSDWCDDGKAEVREELTKCGIDSPELKTRMFATVYFELEPEAKHLDSRDHGRYGSYLKPSFQEVITKEIEKMSFDGVKVIVGSVDLNDHGDA